MGSTARSEGAKKAKDQTLCWDCANASKSGKCPWFTNYTPVDGWWARETIIKTHTTKDDVDYFYETPSYCVIMCPLFERDSFRAGLIPGFPPTHDTLKSAEDEDVKRLCAAIIQRAILDWKMLDYGRIKKLIIDSYTIKAEKLVAWFHSGDFELMLDKVSEHSPEQVREILCVP